MARESGSILGRIENGFEKFNDFTLKLAVAAGVGVVAIAEVAEVAPVLEVSNETIQNLGALVGLAIGTDLAGKGIIQNWRGRSS